MNLTIDSNVAVDVLRSPEALVAWEEFVRATGHRIHLSAVVVAELEAGARSSTARAWLGDRIVAPFARRGHVHAPSAAVWRAAGRLLADHSTGSPRAAWQNDLLLALQAREEDWIVITRDADFRCLQRHVPGLLLAAPYPGA